MAALLWNRLAAFLTDEGVTLTRRALGAHGASRTDAETIAEGAAFATLARFGLDTGDYSFPYIAAWAADRAILARNLTAIQETASALIAVVEEGYCHVKF